MSEADPTRLPRRSFLRRTAKAIGATMAVGLAYCGYEAARFGVERRTIAVAGLPEGWRAKIALLTDIHHGVFTGLEYIAEAVRAANAFDPDVVVLGGDYSLRGGKYVAPCFAELSALCAKLGVLCIPGNHEYYDRIANYREATAGSDFTELTNRHTILRRGGDPLAWAGVDDYLIGSPDPRRALQGVASETPAILLAHNPDQALTCDDPRVRLQLSGHTHGGQIALPWYGPPILPAGFVSGYVQGLYDVGPTSKIYVSRGLGTITPPLRFNCPPELTLIELTSG
ncbi:MAG: metallophosphoesterase [Pirellulales bacterium]